MKKDNEDIKKNLVSIEVDGKNIIYVPGWNRDVKAPTLQEEIQMEIDRIYKKHNIKKIKIKDDAGAEKSMYVLDGKTKQTKNKES